MRKAIGLNSNVGQVVYYYSRRRRRGLYVPNSPLYRTHTFTAANSDIDTAAVFGDTASRTQPVTVAFSLSRSGAGDGVVFEFGSATRGLAVWVSGSDLGVGAGAGSGNDGVTLTAMDAIPATNQMFDFVLSVVPGTGLAELYREGKLIASGVSASASFAGPWADTGHGAVGNIFGTVSSRVPAPNQIALTNVSIIGPISIYLHQRVGA